MDNKWSIKFNTHSREDVMQVCKLLAMAIGEDAIAEKRLDISIVGSVRCGKSAISDGIAAAYSDAHNIHRLPHTPLIENVSGESLMRRSSKTFPVSDNARVFTLIHYINEMDKDHDRHRNAHDKPDQGGIDFITMCGHEPYRKGDISMSFNHNLRCSYGLWARKWEVIIRGDKLKTPQMSEMLDHLRSFHERRNARLTEQGHNDVSLW